MPVNKWESVLKQIAQTHNTTVETIRQEMLSAMEEGQKCPDADVRKQWQKIPHKGKELTLEEFLDYLLEQSR